MVHTKRTFWLLHIFGIIIIHNKSAERTLCNAKVRVLNTDNEIDICFWAKTKSITRSTSNCLSYIQSINGFSQSTLNSLSIVFFSSTFLRLHDFLHATLLFFFLNPLLLEYDIDLPKWYLNAIKAHEIVVRLNTLSHTLNDNFCNRLRLVVVIFVCSSQIQCPLYWDFRSISSTNISFVRCVRSNSSAILECKKNPSNLSSIRIQIIVASNWFLFIICLDVTDVHCTYKTDTLVNPIN